MVRASPAPREHHRLQAGVPAHFQDQPQSSVAQERSLIGGHTVTHHPLSSAGAFGAMSQRAPGQLFGGGGDGWAPTRGLRNPQLRGGEIQYSMLRRRSPIGPQRDERSRLPVGQANEQARAGSSLSAQPPGLHGAGIPQAALFETHYSALTMKFPLQPMPCTPTAPSSWRAAPGAARCFWTPLRHPLRPQGPSAWDGG